ncbi:MAG TPA: 3-deoxy-7-phosphoheptulonate synthase [Elusimicrobia bacterium]|nr:3-deoxy-7-phosphoheptulonate synthase [Elusimicrobiota bacterium]HBT60367.1 3-deoxy-7-phosphoheptulonate synthase [Elusimicrobiota bacterium]
MIIILKPHAADDHIRAIERKLLELGLRLHVSKGEYRTTLGVIGDLRKLNAEQIRAMPYVEDVVRILTPYKLVSREFHPKDSVVQAPGVSIGAAEFVVMAGPCAVETEQQLMESALEVKKRGGKVLRASVFKPRSSPYDFQGLKEDGLKILQQAKKATGLALETEVMDIRDIPLVARYVDIFRVGARNMQNYDLLKELGKVKKPVILKRGMASTIKEFLLAAEYILAEGNPDVIMCERGIRTFETATRSTLDLSAVPVLKQETHLPVIVDPSHASGNRAYVIPMARAALAAGADGIIVEIHPCPEKALCDGPQALTLPMYADMMLQLGKLALAMGKTL